MALLSLGLWSLLFRAQLWAVGKNDIFQAACVLAMFELLVHAADDVAGAFRLRVFLASASLALATVTKPTRFAYAPIFVGLCFRRLRSRGGPVGAPALHSAVIMLVTLLVGSFFYVRNLAVFGSIVNPEILMESVHTSIVDNLKNPRLYTVGVDAVIVLFAACAPLLLYALRLRHSAESVFALLTFHVTGLTAFLVTP